MKIHGLTKMLSIVATVLIWVPLLATLIISLIVSILDQKVRFDALMPAELGLFSLVGGVLLLWTTLRIKDNPKAIIITLALMIMMLIGGQAIAVFSGLATGEKTHTDWVYYLVTGMFTFYTILLIHLAILSISVCRKVFRFKPSE